MDKEKAPNEGQEIADDIIKIVPTEISGCFKVFVNGIEDISVRNVKIEMGVDNRIPLVTLERYCESVELDLGKCLVTSTTYLGNPGKYRQQDI